MAATLSILAILCAIAVPTLSSKSYSLKAAARELYSSMQLAKMQAIRQNSSASITFTSHPDQYQCPPSRTVELKNYKGGIKFQGPGGETFSSATVTFDARGMAAGAGYAYLSNEGNTAYYRVGAATSGHIEIQRYNGSTWE